MSGVVEQLVLGRAPIDVIVFFGAAIKNSGVTARAQFPVESKLEVSKLISGDDVLDGAGLGQHAIDDLVVADDGFADFGLDSAIIVTEGVAQRLKLRIDAGNVGLRHLFVSLFFLFDFLLRPALGFEQ